MSVKTYNNILIFLSGMTPYKFFKKFINKIL